MPIVPVVTAAVPAQPAALTRYVVCFRLWKRFSGVQSSALSACSDYNKHKLHSAVHTWPSTCIPTEPRAGSARRLQLFRWPSNSDRPFCKIEKAMGTRTLQCVPSRYATPARVRGTPPTNAPEDHRVNQNLWGLQGEPCRRITWHYI